MDTYELELIRRAWEACRADTRGLRIEVSPPEFLEEWRAEAWATNVDFAGHLLSERPPLRMDKRSPTLTEALASLLGELHAEVPERPDEHNLLNWGMAFAEAGLTEAQIDFIRAALKLDRLAILTLLEEGP